MHRHAFAALIVLAAGAAPAIAQDAPAETPAICYYAGLEYSQWAELPNGQICQPNGTWSYPDEKTSDAPAAE